MKYFRIILFLPNLHSKIGSEANWRTIIDLFNRININTFYRINTKIEEMCKNITA